MPSRSLLVWQTTRSAALADLEAAYRLVLTTRRGGRRAAAQQVRHSYVPVLSAQFQGFCRDLHTEAVDALVLSITSLPLRLACRQALVQDRKLDRGNPDHGNLGADFGRLIPSFWAEVGRLAPVPPRRPSDADSLNSLRAWRNAISHQDFTPLPSGSSLLRPQAVREWRRTCDRLAATFDEVVRQHIQSINGSSPW